jgi:phage terminase small subunit
MGRKKTTICVPEGYSEATRKFMKVVQKELHANGELTPMMEGVIIMLRECYETFQKAARTLREDDEVIAFTLKDERVAHPAVKVLMQSNQQVLALMKELGLTTRSRKVIDKVGGGGADQLSLFEAGYE